MINWSRILYGGALTAVGGAMLIVAVPRWRRPVLIGTAVVGVALALLGWQPVLHLTHAQDVSTDLPFRPFLVSWQDTGCGVTTFAVTALAFAQGPLRRYPAPAANRAAATGTSPSWSTPSSAEFVSGSTVRRVAAHRGPAGRLRRGEGGGD